MHKLFLETAYLKYSYTTDNLEKEMLLYEALIDQKIEKCFYKLEMAERKHQENLRNIDLMLMTESATFDDMTRLYLEEEEKDNMEKDGLLGTIWKAVKSLISKTKDFLFGKRELNEEDLPKEAKITNTDELISNSKSLLEKIQGYMNGNESMLEDCKNFIKKHPILSIGAVVLGRKQLYKEYQKAKEYINLVENKTTEFEKLSESEKFQKDQEGLNIFKKVINELRATVAKLKDVFSVFFKKDYQDFKKEDHVPSKDTEGDIELSEKDIADKKKRKDEITEEINKLNAEIEQKEKKGFKQKGIRLIGSDKNDLDRYSNMVDKGKSLGHSDKEKYEKLKDKYPEYFDFKNDLKELKARLKSLRDERNEIIDTLNAQTNRKINKTKAKFDSEQQDRMKNKNEKEDSNDNESNNEEKNDEKK